MIDARFRPMADPKIHKSRKSSTFRASYAKTLELLEDELRWLCATDIVIEAGFTLDQIRNDGWPRSSARPQHSAARLSFKSRGKSIAFPCDTYDSIDDNLRAIALTLQSLRAIDRYGVTQDAEQYKGWTAIDAPKPNGSMDHASAIAFLSLHGETPGHEIARSKNARDIAYRTAAKKLHPDMTGGSDDAFKRLQDAMRVLTEATQ